MGTADQTNLQQRYDAYVDARKRFLDAQTEAHELREDEIDFEAYLIAKRAVQDRERLVGMVTRGELMLHEITYRNPYGRMLTIEQALLELLSSAADANDHGRGSDIARALIAHLEQDADIREQAERIVDQSPQALA